MPDLLDTDRYHLLAQRKMDGFDELPADLRAFLHEAPIDVPTRMVQGWCTRHGERVAIQMVKRAIAEIGS